MSPISHFKRDIREHSEGRVWLLLAAMAAAVVAITYI